MNFEVSEINVLTYFSVIGLDDLRDITYFYSYKQCVQVRKSPHNFLLLEHATSKTPFTFCLVLRDESRGCPFSLLNDEQISNKVRVFSTCHFLLPWLWQTLGTGAIGALIVFRFLDSHSTSCMDLALRSKWLFNWGLSRCMAWGTKSTFPCLKTKMTTDNDHF